MRVWLLAVAAASIAVVVLIAATSGSNQPPSERFNKALTDGASCERLFEIRNELHPKDPVIYEMNAQLRSIGCYGSSSNRNDR